MGKYKHGLARRGAKVPEFSVWTERKTAMHGMPPDGTSKLVQGTREWKLARVGKVTASRVQDIIATVKSGGLSAGYKNYMAELVAERLTGEPAEKFQSAAMAYGSEMESEARFAYALHTGAEVEEVGFIEHPSINSAGASPDGLVGTDGLLEVKCPGTGQHIDTLLRGTISVGYASQMQFQMACTGRQWCDFASYDRRMPKHMRLWIKRIVRDQDVIERLDAEVQTFLTELDATVAKLNERFPAAVAA